MTFPSGFPLDQILSTSATLLVNHIWQSAALTCCVAIVLRVFPAMTARHRFALWEGALFLATVTPLLAFASGESQRASHSLLSGEISPPPLWILPPLAGRLLLFIWVTTSIFCLARFLCAFAQVQRLLRTSSPSEVGERADGILQELNASGRHVSLRYNEALKSPVSIGLVAKTIIISRTLVDELSDDEIAQIFRHELAHLERFDTWITLATKLILALFPLSPALYYIERQLSKTREVACDDVVLESTGAAHQYASCLTRIAEATRTQYHGLVTMFAGGPSQLAIRIDHILSGRKPQKQKSLHLLGGGVVIALLACTALHNSREVVSFRPRPGLVALASPHQPRIETAAAADVSVHASSHRRATVRRVNIRSSSRLRAAKTQMYVASTKPPTAPVVTNPPVESLVVVLPHDPKDSEETFILVVSTAPARQQLEKQLISFLQI